MQWLTRLGPFWDEIQEHSSDDWYECNGDIVTDTAVGEAAYRLFHEIPHSLVSMTPSSWTTCPLPVIRRYNAHACSIDVPNYWDADELETALGLTPQYRSPLGENSRRRPGVATRI